MNTRSIVNTITIILIFTIVGCASPSPSCWSGLKTFMAETRLGQCAHALPQPS